MPSPVDSTSVIPPPAPSSACHPEGSASVALPTAPSGACLLGPPGTIITPPTNSSPRLVLPPATSALPIVGLDQTATLGPTVPGTQTQVPTDGALHHSPCLATTFASDLHGLQAPAPIDDCLLYENISSQASSASTLSGFQTYFVARMQAEYCTLDMSRVPCIQSLKFAPSIGSTAATQRLVNSIRDALSGKFDVADPSGTVKLDPSAWVQGRPPQIDESCNSRQSRRYP